MIIGLDLDGVIIDHTQNKIKKAKELGYFIKANETPSGKLKKLISLTDYRLIQKFIYNEGTSSAKPMEGVLKAVKNLSKNHQIVIVSRRAKESRKIALDWLEKHGFLNYIKRKNIYFVKSDPDKNMVAKHLKTNLYIDDKLKVLRSLKDVPVKILFDYFNVVRRTNKEIKKIKNWQMLSSASKIKSFLTVNSQVFKISE